MKNYDQNKFEQNVPKLSNIWVSINELEPFYQEEIDSWELSKEQIDFWHSEVRKVADKILSLLELKYEKL